MKFWMIPLYLLLTFWALSAYPASSLAPARGVAVRRDASSTNFPTTFGSAGAGILSSLSGKTHFSCCTTSTTDMAVSTTTTATNCTGGTDNFYLPAAPSGGTSCITRDFTFLNSTLCLRSYGSAISSGITGCDAW